MFEISFSELLVIAVVALIVIGPEKLPKVARTAGAFFGRMQRLLAQVKDEVNREARFHELQQLQDEVKSSLQPVVEELYQTQQQIASASQLASLPPELARVPSPEEAPIVSKVTRKPRARKSAELLAPVTAPAAGVKKARKPRALKSVPEGTHPGDA